MSEPDRIERELAPDRLKEYLAQLDKFDDFCDGLIEDGDREEDLDFFHDFFSICVARRIDSIARQLMSRPDELPSIKKELKRNEEGLDGVYQGYIDGCDGQKPSVKYKGGFTRVSYEDALGFSKSIGRANIGNNPHNCALIRSCFALVSASRSLLQAVNFTLNKPGAEIADVLRQLGRIKKQAKQTVAKIEAGLAERKTLKKDPEQLPEDWLKNVEAPEAGLSRKAVEHQSPQDRIRELEAELEKPAPKVQVIPDVHGSIKNLQNIYDETADHVILLGDLIDRGPASLPVLNFVREKIASGHARLLLGNHEAMFISAILDGNDDEAEQWIINSGYNLLQECGYQNVPPSNIYAVRYYWQTNKDAIRKDKRLIEFANFVRRNSRIFIIEDGNLYVHGGIPLNNDGSLMAVGDPPKKGLQLFQAMQSMHEQGQLDYHAAAWGEATPLFACNMYDRELSWMEIMRKHGVQKVIDQLNEGLSDDQKIKRIFFGHDRDDGGKVKEFEGLIYGLDTAMSEAYSDRDGSLNLDGNGIRYVARPGDNRFPYQGPLIIDDQPRTVADTDRGREIRKRVEEIKSTKSDIPGRVVTKPKPAEPPPEDPYAFGKSLEGLDISGAARKIFNHPVIRNFIATQDPSMITAPFETVSDPSTHALTLRIKIGPDQYSRFSAIVPLPRSEMPENLRKLFDINPDAGNTVLRIRQLALYNDTKPRPQIIKGMLTTGTLPKPTTPVPKRPIKPLLDEQLKRFHEGDAPQDQSLPAEEKKRRKTWLDSLGAKAKKLIFPAIIAALAAGAFTKIIPKALEWLHSSPEDSTVVLPDEAKDYSYGIVPEGAKAEEAEPLNDWKKFPNDNLEVYNFGHAKLGIAMPDGSWLYVPDVKGFSGGDMMFNDQTMNQAYVFPPDGKSNKEWRKVRYPVQELAKRKCSLGQDGLWRNKEGEVFTVLQAGHLLQLAQGKKPAQFLPFNEAKMKPVAELGKYYQSPIDLNKIDTSIPKGFIDAESELSLAGIKFEPCYRGYDNTVSGKPLYPPDYRVMIPKANVADLAAAEQELFARYSRHLGVGDAYRSKQVQAFLRDNMPRGMVAKPSDKAPHMLGAMDIFITDAEYIEIGPQFAFAPFGGTGEQTGKTYGVPETWQQAQAQNWTQENFEVWDAARDILAEHGFVIPPAKGEFWHVERLN